MKINLDKDSLKELRGKLLNQEKLREQQSSPKTFRPDLLKDAPKNTSEQSNSEQVEDEEEMGM